ncbi:MAG: hypothetical protein MK033_07420, partial [Candidatus Caenarcaniphilales bacterium]|nr:hypothetical protein [Candidatus Caenarcaniphilales bacterium]
SFFTFLIFSHLLIYVFTGLNFSVHYTNLLVRASEFSKEPGSHPIIKQKFEEFIIRLKTYAVVDPSVKEEYESQEPSSMFGFGAMKKKTKKKKGSFGAMLAAKSPKVSSKPSNKAGYRNIIGASAYMNFKEADGETRKITREDYANKVNQRINNIASQYAGTILNSVPES